MKLYIRLLLLSTLSLSLYIMPGIASAYEGTYTYTSGADQDFWWVLVNKTNGEISGRVQVTSSEHLNVYGDLDLISLKPGETTPVPTSGTGFRGPWFSSDGDITTWTVTIRDIYGQQKRTPWSHTVCKEGFDVHKEDIAPSYDNPVTATVTYHGSDPHNYDLVITMPHSGDTCTIPFQ